MVTVVIDLRVTSSGLEIYSVKLAAGAKVIAVLVLLKFADVGMRS